MRCAAIDPLVPAMSCKGPSGLFCRAVSICFVEIELQSVRLASHGAVCGKAIKDRAYALPSRLRNDKKAREALAGACPHWKNDRGAPSPRAYWPHADMPR